MAWGEVYFRTNWYLHPSSRLATIDMGRKLGELRSLLGETELSSHLTQHGRGEVYLRAKFHLDPSNRLATVHQRHRQTDRTDNGPIA